MRILVVSDTHGDEGLLRQVVQSQSKAEVVIHLGDGERDFENVKNSFDDKMFLQVRGNCDWGSDLPLVGVITLEGKKIFYTHGHYYNVKHGMYEFISAAREHKADIALYGHTHNAQESYDDGLYIMNPGSLHGYRGSYGFVDITDNGIVTNIVRV